MYTLKTIHGIRRIFTRNPQQFHCPLIHCPNLHQDAPKALTPVATNNSTNRYESLKPHVYALHLLSYMCVNDEVDFNAHYKINFCVFIMSVLLQFQKLHEAIYMFQTGAEDEPEELALAYLGVEKLYWKVMYQKNRGNNSYKSYNSINRMRFYIKEGCYIMKG